MGTLGTSDGTNFFEDRWLVAAGVSAPGEKTLGFRYFDEEEHQLGASPRNSWSRILLRGIIRRMDSRGTKDPSTRTNGDLSVTLTNLVSGLSKGDGVYNSPSYGRICGG